MYYGFMYFCFYETSMPEKYFFVKIPKDEPSGYISVNIGGTVGSIALSKEGTVYQGTDEQHAKNLFAGMQRGTMSTYEVREERIYVTHERRGGNSRSFALIPTGKNAMSY